LWGKATKAPFKGYPAEKANLQFFLSFLHLTIIGIIACNRLPKGSFVSAFLLCEKGETVWKRQYTFKKKGRCKDESSAKMFAAFN